MGTSPFVFAHFSDVHLGPLSLPATRYWNVKRGLGFINWHRKRRRVHRPDVIEMLLEDLNHQRVDHVVVTGDLINLGLPAEYEAAAAWLKTVGTSHDVSVVPGNHDIYTRLTAHEGVRLWRDYMTGDGAASGRAFSAAAGHAGDPAAADLVFPYVRKRGPLAFIGVNSAEPTPPFVAAGAVDKGQLGRLEEILRSLKDAEPALFKVVLIHHPPLPGQAPPRRALKDAAEFEKVLHKYSPDLVLHGHNHSDTVVWSRLSGEKPSAGVGEDGLEKSSFPVIGIASGSAARVHGKECLARYNLISVRSAGLEEAGHEAATACSAGWHVEVVGRGLLAPGGQVGEIDRYRLC